MTTIKERVKYFYFNVCSSYSALSTLSTVTGFAVMTGGKTREERVVSDQSICEMFENAFKKIKRHKMRGAHANRMEE